MSRYVCCCLPLRKKNSEQQSLTSRAEDGYGNGDGPSDTKKDYVVPSDTPPHSSDIIQSSPATRSLSETTTPSTVTSSINHDLCGSEDPQCSPDLNSQAPDTSTSEQHGSSTASSAVGGEKTESSSQEEIDMSTTTVTSALDFDAEIVVPSAATTSAADEDCGEGDDTCDRITYKSQYNEETHRMNPLQSSMRTVSKSEVTTLQ